METKKVVDQTILKTPMIIITQKLWDIKFEILSNIKLDEEFSK